MFESISEREHGNRKGRYIQNSHCPFHLSPIVKLVLITYIHYLSDVCINIILPLTAFVSHTLSDQDLAIKSLLNYYCIITKT